MKIGMFAREFHLPQHTIRYYVKLGLLIPEVRNHQYNFNEDCRADMKLIEGLKAMEFSLKEIHKILSLRRLSNFASPEDSGQLIRYMKEHLRKLEAERDKWAEKQKRLEKRIASFKRQE